MDPRLRGLLPHHQRAGNARHRHPAVLYTARCIVIDHQRDTLKGKARIVPAPEPYSACLSTAGVNCGDCRFSDFRHRASLTGLFPCPNHHGSVLQALQGRPVA